MEVKYMKYLEDVVVFVTSEDIVMYIIIVYCCTPIGDVFPSFRNVITIHGH